MSAGFSEGESIFFRHPLHSWVVGKVVTVAQKTDRKQKTTTIYSCRVEDAERKEVKQQEVVENLSPDDVAHMQADCLNDQVSDLLNLTVLHDSSLLRCLYLRYMNDFIYTNIGAIVVALNPFNFKIPRYMDDQMKHYLVEGHVIEKNVPHSWAQAHNTYYEMIDNNENQCVLISGESGAGKTEATKIVMKYLGAVSSLSGTEEEKKAGAQVGTKLAACSPILESFGNAKTVRNDNSSRFGKFVKVKFDGKGLLIGAHTTKYLLEKSRIITAGRGERVYHSFYLVVRGKFKSYFHLEDETKYGSINSGGCLHNKEFDTPEDFTEVCDAMKGVGVTDDEIQSVWLVPSGILSMQNISFLPAGDGCAIHTDSQKYLHHACRIWGIDETIMKRELLTSTIALPGGQSATNPNSEVKARDIRDAMCKAMYDGVFGWLVDKCNSLCDIDATGNWVGLLDIFGFENFEYNSFEQLCINLTNETLQNHYNNYIFSRDMDECRAEGIDVTAIECPDNGPCLKMITGQGGIMPLLDDVCALSDSGTDRLFLDKVAAAHSANPHLEVPKVSSPWFAIDHYAAKVKYEVEGWLDKNRDTLKDAIKLLVRASKDPIVQVVLPQPVEKKGKDLTVGGFFASQLKALMALINSTNPHWIRCIKPHPAKKPLMLHGDETMKQLESSGVLGTVKIRKAGYPVRIPLEKFARRYIVLATEMSDNKAIITSAIAACGIEMPARAQLGHTKVFMKADAYQVMEKMRLKALEDKVARMQIFGRGFIDRRWLFQQYVEKHRARLMAEKKAREDRERAEREAEERRRREEEDRIRRIQEAEERRLREQRQAEDDLKKRAVVSLQRYIRGGLIRHKIYRTVLEQQRASFEYEREDRAFTERLQAREVDFVRLRSERQWIAWLNEVDELKRYQESELARNQEKVDRKKRIIARELSKKEEAARQIIREEALRESEMLFAKCEIMLRHKKELIEKARRLEGRMQDKKASHLSQGSPIRQPNFHLISRSGTADARSNETLADYATRRAMAFDQYYAQPLNARPAAQSSTPSRSAPSALPGNGSSLFERSRNRWARQEEWLDSRLPVDGPFHMDPSYSPNAYSGPYRAAPTATAQQTSFSARSDIPTTPRGGQSQSTMGQQVRGAYEWHEVFNRR